MCKLDVVWYMCSNGRVRPWAVVSFEAGIEEEHSAYCQPRCRRRLPGVPHILRTHSDHFVAVQSGDITTTDDSASDLPGEVPAPRGGFFFGPAQATGSEAPPEDGTDEDGTATDGTGVPPADDTVAVPASAPAVVPDSAALSGTVSISTDSRNPGLVSEATAAEVQPEEGDFDNSLTTALLATFAVLASSIVALIAVVAVLTELRRRRKKEWLRESVDDHVATSASIPGEVR